MARDVLLRAVKKEACLCYLLSARGLITLSDVWASGSAFQCKFDPWPKIDLAVALAARFITPSSILAILGDAILAERALETVTFEPSKLRQHAERHPVGGGFQVDRLQ